jgi:hypothetical protein
VRVFVVLLVVALGGCILLVDDRTGLSRTCDFSGSATACGSCIAGHCQAQIDACCSDDACASGLSALDSCAAGGGCAGLAPAIGSCVAASCPTCGPLSGDAGGESDATPPDARVDGGPRFRSDCFMNGDECLCSADTSATDVACDETVITAAICCMDHGYPTTPNTFCSCVSFSCRPTSGGESCSKGPPDTDVHAASTGICCLSHTTVTGDCYCFTDSSGCGVDTLVPACNPQYIECGSNATRVKSCSF